MKVKKNKEIKFNKIKVNKKDSNSNFNFSQNDFNIKNKYNYSSNIVSPNASNIFPYNKNDNNIPYIVIKNYNPNSNSEEKILKNKNKFYINNQQIRETYNFIEPKKNYKNPLNKKNINENTLFIDDINNNINMTKKRKTNRNFINSENTQYNKSHNLSIKENYINADTNNIFLDKNNYQTIGNNKINNFIKEFKLINNYYENDNKNINNYNLHTSNNRYILNNSLDNKRKNYFFNKKSNSKKYNNNKKINNKNYNYLIMKNINNDMDEINYRQIKNYNHNNSYRNKLRLRNSKITKIDSVFNNSYNELNLNDFDKRNTHQNIYIKSKSPYRKNEYFNEYVNNFKEDNYKKLFNIYRGKLIQEFMRHFKKAVNKYLLRELKNIMYFIHDNILLNNENYIFMLKKSRKNLINNNNYKKINNSIKIDDKKYLDEEIRKTNKINDKKYIKIFYSEKKFPDEIHFKKTLTSRNKLNIKPKNIYKNIKDNINNQINYNESNKLIFNNKLIGFIEKNPISKINFSHSREIKRINSSNNKINDKNYIYKKKIRKNNALNIKKEENRAINIITQNQKKLKGKIIDIDINLGMPIKEISDISLMHNFNKNNNKKVDNNTNFKNKKRPKSRRRLSLPKKIYLEEGYDINNNNNNYNEKNKFSVPYKTYSYDNKKYRINNLINLNRVMESNKEINFENILITNDKLLCIRLNSISLIMNNINLKKNNIFSLNSLEINQNENIFINDKKNNINSNNNKNQNISNYSLKELHNSKKLNNILELEKQNFNKVNIIESKEDKYLLSCMKFMIKTINKIFLKEEFIYFKKCIGYI